jgi:hypothetical protein
LAVDAGRARRRAQLVVKHWAIRAASGHHGGSSVTPPEAPGSPSVERLSHRAPAASSLLDITNGTLGPFAPASRTRAVPDAELLELCCAIFAARPGTIVH